MPAADRGRDRRRGLRRVHPLLPGEGGLYGRGGGDADPDADHRRLCGGVRRDHAAVRPRRGEEIRPGAFTERYSAFWLGTRSLDSMQDAGILPGFAGIVVSDRYQNYFHPRWEHIAGNQAACLTYCGTTRTAPRATRARSGPCRRSGRCAADPCLARRPRAGPAPHPAGVRDRWSTSSATPSSPGWPASPASPARRTARSRNPAASCWNSAATAERRAAVHRGHQRVAHE